MLPNPQRPRRIYFRSCPPGLWPSSLTSLQQTRHVRRWKGGFEFKIKNIRHQSGLPTRFAEVKEERETRGTRSKARREPAPARAATDFATVGISIFLSILDSGFQFTILSKCIVAQNYDDSPHR